jgi:hypothetical protein
MALTNQDLQSIREVVRDEVTAQHTAFHRWMAVARSKIADGALALANGERIEPDRVFAEIREIQARRRMQRSRA